MGRFNSYPTAIETQGSRLRRLAAKAERNNPVINPPLLGSTPWIVLTGAWTMGTVYTAGQLVSNGSNAYVCVNGGTSGAAAPTGSSLVTGVSDGVCFWQYYPLTVGSQVSNGGKVYEVITSGLPSTLAGGPTGFAADITDGSVHWAYVGKQTAPVIKWSNTHNASLTVSKNPASFLADGSGYFRYKGGVPDSGKVGVGLPSTNITSTGVGTSGGNYQGGLSSTYSVYETRHEGTIFEISFAYGQQNLIFGFVTVNGVRISVNQLVWGGAGSSYLSLDFTNCGGRAVRNIAFEVNLAGYPTAINIEVTASVSYPSYSDNFSVALLGDSLSVGTQAVSIASGWFAQFCHLVGLPDSTCMGIGGTGIIANGGSFTPYQTHGMPDLARLNAWRPLGAIFVQASTNDSANSSSMIQAAVTLLITAIRAVYPTVPLFFLGELTCNSAITNHQANDIIPMENAYAMAIAAWITATNDKYIAWWPVTADLAGPMVKGTGRVSLPTGDGNADICISDGTHSNDAGYLLWAKFNVSRYYVAINAMQ